MNLFQKLKNVIKFIRELTEYNWEHDTDIHEEGELR